jgi:hypothetical protein
MSDRSNNDDAYSRWLLPYPRAFQALLDVVVLLLLLPQELHRQHSPATAVQLCVTGVAGVLWCSLQQFRLRQPRNAPAALCAQAAELVAAWAVLWAFASTAHDALPSDERIVRALVLARLGVLSLEFGLDVHARVLWTHDTPAALYVAHGSALLAVHGVQQLLLVGCWIRRACELGADGFAHACLALACACTTALTWTTLRSWWRIMQCGAER